MRKLGLLIVALFVILPIALIAISAQAAPVSPIPASVTADYVGGGWTCRVLAYRHPSSAQHSVVELQCTGPDNRPRVGVDTTLGCPDTRTQRRLYVPCNNPAGCGPVSSYPTYITAVSPAALAMDINGVPVALTRVQAIPSPAPYPGCASARDRR